MEALFLRLLNMAIAAGWVILGILLLRLLLGRAPKAFRCALWALVAVRLVCPFSLESVVSLMPSAETVPREILMDREPAIESGITAVDSAVNPIIADSLSPNIGDSVNPMQVVVFLASRLWVIGMAGMALYALISCIRLRRRVAASLWLEGNVWMSDGVKSPFIFGLFSPRIYLPSDLEGQNLACVIAHEKAHLERRDHLWKPFGFLLLSVYWFQPLCWIAYILLCRDIELACDERVVKDMGKEEKKQYAEALLSYSAPRHMISACPLAFGESGVKERVKGVLRYHKPTFWMIAAGAVACVTAAVCLLTDPVAAVDKEIFGARYSVEKVLYDMPWMNAAYSAEDAPEYIFTADRSLMQKSSGGVFGSNDAWNMVGVFREDDGIRDRLPGLFRSDGAALADSVQAEQGREIAGAVTHTPQAHTDSSRSGQNQEAGQGQEAEWSQEAKQNRETDWFGEVPGFSQEAQALLGKVERGWRVDADWNEGLRYFVLETRDGQILLAVVYGAEGEESLRWLWKMEKHPVSGDTEYFEGLIASMGGIDARIFAIYESDNMPGRLIAGYHNGNKRGFAVFKQDSDSSGWRITGYSSGESDGLSHVTLGEERGFDHSVTVVLSSRGDLAYVTAQAGKESRRGTVGIVTVPVMCVFEWEGFVAEETVEVHCYNGEGKELE